ncbi:hypothetical protein SAZ11_45575 [Streptomyces sp. FXJ1.4098]|nr:hypothetical protein [Streptomyces sp. FXJ1.4098]
MGVDAGGDANVGVAPLIMSRICSSVGTVRCAALALISCGLGGGFVGLGLAD